MKYIKPKKMSNEVQLLRETALLYDLKPEQLVPFVGVGFKTIYNWFNGQQPLAAQAVKILRAVRRIDAEFAEPELEKGNAVWGSTDQDDPAIIEDKKFRASVRPVFYRLMAVCPDAEKRLVADNWPGFVEILGLLKKHDIGIPRRKKRS